MRQATYKNFPAYQCQKGITLIEVLVSMVLMAVIGLGAAYISGRTAVMHRDQNIHLHTVNQMRQQLENSSECGGKSIGTHEVEIQVAETSVDLDCVVQEEGYTVAANDSIGGGVASSSPGAIKVNSAKLAVKEDDTFVPIKVQMSPREER